MRLSRRSRVLDSSVAALLQNHGYSGEPEELVKTLSLELLAEAYGGPPSESDLPIDTKMLASFRGAAVKEGPGGASGSIRHDGKQYVIRISTDDGATRKQFTIAHEISHIPFLAASGEVERTDNSSIGNFDWSDQEEYLCDIGAVELAMPESAVRPLIPKRPTMADVVRIAQRCGTSIEATGRRVVELCGLPGCFVVLETALKPAEIKQIEIARNTSSLFPDLDPDPPLPRLRVKYASGPGPHIPKHKSVSDDCELAHLRRGMEVNFVGPTGLIDESLSVSARNMPYYVGDELIKRVVAIVYQADAWDSTAVEL